MPAHWPYLRISSYLTHAPLPPEQPCMPPQSNHACLPPPREQPHMPPQEQPCMPLGSNHAHPPPRSNHACPPWEQPRTPHQSNDACPPPPQATMHNPQATTHAPSPLEATTHAPPPPRGQNVDTRFWKYYLAPTSLRAVMNQKGALRAPLYWASASMLRQCCDNTSDTGVCSFCWNFTERQILWSLCSVDFHTLTLQLPIQTLHSVAPELPSFCEFTQNFSKTSTPPVWLKTMQLLQNG